MIRVVVVDDQVLVRAGFSVLLRTADDTEVVGEAGDGAEVVEVVTHERPDVVLMDIRMPGTDGLEATRVAVARGLSNTEIADSLSMSPATAKTHVSRLLVKLHARDRAQLVMLAYEAGVVAPGAA